MPYYKIWGRYILPLLIVITAGCTTAAAPSMPAGYSWSQARVVKLEPALDEISGISYEPKLHAFVSINDEKGKVYVLDETSLRVTKEYSFAGKGDYEDIVVTDKGWYVLRSDGHLWEMNFDGSNVTDIKEYTYSGKHTVEFESIYWDRQAQQLVLVVKKARRDTEDRTTYGYAFNIATKEFSEAPVMNIPWDAVAAAGKTELKIFHPSAAAVNPFTGELYVLASIEKLLVVLNTAHAVTGVYQLDRAKCLQPEGISFDPKGNLYISNEAAGATPNTIVFPYRSKSK